MMRTAYEPQCQNHAKRNGINRSSSKYNLFNYRRPTEYGALTHRATPNSTLGRSAEDESE